jgi:hypothetical protein
MLDGVGAEAARKQVGVSHTPAELHVFKFQWFIADLPEPGTGDWTPTPELIRFLKTDQGWGWGRIMVATNAGEAKVRRMFEDATGIESVGIRTGKGGRFLGDDPKLYEETLKATGTDIPKGERPKARLFAERKKLMAHEFAELKEMALEAGVITKGQKGLTKTKVVSLLVPAE